MSQMLSALIFVAGICFGVGMTMLDDLASMTEQYKLGFEKGQKAALNVRKPSEELEIACASLWVGEQNRIYWERNQK
jgi:hypothetical protein